MLAPRVHAVIMLAMSLAMTCFANATAAQADADRGRALAEALCVRCHMNRGQGEKQGPMGVPGFDAVANRPEQTHEGIVTWLRSAPPRMPDHHLTFDEAQHLAEYILTLRREQ